MRKMLVFLLMAVFLSGCIALVFAEVLENDIEREKADLPEKIYAAFESSSPAERELQSNLTRWYNLNLRSQTKDADFMTAYKNILDYPEHAMGVLVIPSTGEQIPIYHGIDENTDGAGHFPHSSFPTGGEGNHSVLTGDFNMKQGDVFLIHILNMALPYQVEEVEIRMDSNISCSLEPNKDLCTLITEQAGSIQVIRASAASVITEKAIIRVEEDSGQNDGWWLAACILLGMGIVLVPLLSWSGREDL